MSARVRTSFPQTRLARLLARTGGRSRDAAIAGAQKRLEWQRPSMQREIEALIDGVEAAVAGQASITAQMLDAIAQAADRIVSLALMLDETALAQAAMHLCDLCQLLGPGSAIAPVTVFVQALRLLAPGAGPVDAGPVLQGLVALRAHLNLRA